MRSALDVFRRPRPFDLAGAPAYVSRRAGGMTPYGMSTDRSSREAQLNTMSASATLFTIVDRLAFSTSVACWRLYESAASGKSEDRTEITKHPALDVWRKPNDFFTGQELRETTGQHFELAGEGWYVIVRVGKLPVELWPMRPDRVLPQPSAENYLLGYWYIEPDGTKVPLDVADVMLIRRPHPTDSYRGISPVVAAMPDIEGGRLAREWNLNFFRNSAIPGGVIEYPEKLTDGEWLDFQERWRETHQGVSAAHRVAMLELGMKWVPNQQTMRDMQFIEALGLTSEGVRTAFGYPKPLLGAVDDVNRANGDAANELFQRELVKPRLIRVREMLNNDFLPQFGAAAANREFDFDDPVPDNTDLANATLTAKSMAAKTFIVDMHAKPETVMEALELPGTIVFEPPPPEPAPALPGGAPSGNVQRNAVPLHAPDPLATLRGEPARNAVQSTGEAGAAVAAAVDLSELQRAWERELDSLITRWRDVTTAQRADLKRQVRTAVEDGNLDKLANLTTGSERGAEILTTAMIAMAEIGAAAAQAEASAQGVVVELAEQDDSALEEMAVAMALLLAAGLASSAGSEALRQYAPGTDGDAIATAVDEHLDGLSEAYLRDRLGGTLTRAQNVGRIAQMAAGPTPRYFASEVLDKNTCTPCREIDGTELPNELAAMLAYGGSGYFRCEGTWRCRGTVVAVYQ